VTPGGYKIITAPEGSTYDAGARLWPSIMGGSIFNSGFNSLKIKEIDLKTGELLSENEFEGSGPGEYRNISYYETGVGFHFIADFTLGKMIQYDSEWNHVRDRSLGDYMSLPPYKLAYSDSVFYYPAGYHSEYLITGLRFDGRNTSSHSFHKRIIPVGKQPHQYNKLIMDSHNGQLAVMNHNMPFVFLYNDNHTLEEIIQVGFPAWIRLNPTGRPAETFQVVVPPMVTNRPSSIHRPYR